LKLFRYGSHVMIYRVPTDSHSLGDLLVAHSAREAFKDLDLPFGEHGGCAPYESYQAGESIRFGSCAPVLRDDPPI
jgi:hypothetical protein